VNANTISTTSRNTRASEYLRDLNGRFLGSRKSKTKPTTYVEQAVEAGATMQQIRKDQIMQAAYPTLGRQTYPEWDVIFGESLTLRETTAETAPLTPPRPATPEPLDTENPRRTGSAPSHTRVAFDPKTMPAIVKWAAGVVEELKADAIAACGHSGLPVAGAVSFLTGVPVLAVRKDGEPVVAGGSFAGRVSGVLPGGVKARRWVWIDDFLSSGGTFRRSSQHLWKEGYIAYPWPEAVLEYRYGQNERVPLSEYKVNITPESFPGFDFSHAPESVPFISWKWKR
jgi:hypothetical protein